MLSSSSIICWKKNPNPLAGGETTWLSPTPEPAAAATVGDDLVVSVAMLRYDDTTLRGQWVLIV